VGFSYFRAASALKRTSQPEEYEKTTLNLWDFHIFVLYYPIKAGPLLSGLQLVIV
jgi:hypothetical protein